MSFKGDVSRFTEKTNARSSKFVRLLVSKLGESLILKTPVGDPSGWKTKHPPAGYVGGTARANWQYGNGFIPNEFLNEQDGDGNRTLSRIINKTSSGDPYTVHYITNNVPYIQALEDGHSRQAPQGMLKTTLIEFKGIFNAIKT